VLFPTLTDRTWRKITTVVLVILIIASLLLIGIALSGAIP